MKETNYSVILDTMIGAGADIIHGNGTAEGLNTCLAKVLSSHANEIPDLKRDMERLYQDIKTCRKELDGEELLRIEPSNYYLTGTSIWPNSMDPDNEDLCPQGSKMCRLMFYFDLSVYLETSLTACKEALQELKEYQALLDIARQISDHIVDPPEPFWARMIPYNTLRNNSLLNIPDKHHYLFPWYAYWAEEPADTLQCMVDFLVEARLQNKPLSSGGFSPALLAEIEGDKTLLNLLAKTVFPLEAIAKSVSHDSLLKNEDAISLRLLHAADQVAFTISLPETFSFEEVSRSLEEEGEIPDYWGEGGGLKEFYRFDKTQNKRLADFRRALCDLSLSRAERLEVLEKFSKNLSWLEERGFKLEDLSADIPFVKKVFEQWREALKDFISQG